MSMIKKKKDAEKFQHQLLDLLKEEPNRVCADCRTRGPRWASWNLGVFICIRCAGIHRNLGVHISKVKSVNLDTWTQEQVDNMLAWGNGIGNEYYEYKLPADFRRPTSDQAAEKFIRSKYDKKSYSHDNFDYASSMNKHRTPDPIRKTQATKSATSAAVKVSAPTSSIPVVPLKTKANEPYRLPKVPIAQPKAVAKAAVAKAASEQPSLLQVSLDISAPRPSGPKPTTSKPAAPSPDLVDLFGDMVSAPSKDEATDSPNLMKEEPPKKSVKESIMSLYSTTSLNSTPNPPSFPAQHTSTFPQQFNHPNQQHFQGNHVSQNGPQAMSQGNQFGNQGNQFQNFSNQGTHQFQQPGNQQILQQQIQAQQQLLNQLQMQGQNVHHQAFQQPQQQQFQQNGMQFNGLSNGTTQNGQQQQQQQFYNTQQQLGMQQFGQQQVYHQQSPSSQQTQLDAVQKQLQQLKVQSPPMQQTQQVWAQGFGTT